MNPDKDTRTKCQVDMSELDIMPLNLKLVLYKRKRLIQMENGINPWYSSTHIIHRPMEFTHGIVNGIRSWYWKIHPWYSSTHIIHRPMEFTHGIINGIHPWYCKIHPWYSFTHGIDPWYCN